MNELPDYLPGILPMYGLQEPAPVFSVGNDIVINPCLKLNDCPFTDPTNWDLNVIVKRYITDYRIVWNGDLRSGLHFDKDSKQFYFRIPKTFSSTLYPGEFIYAVVGTQKPGTGIPFDICQTLAEGRFSLVLDASSL